MKEELTDKTIEELEQEGYRIIDIIAGDIPPSKEMEFIIDKITDIKKDTFYSDILYTLTSEKFTEQEAKQLWQEILKHKYVISEQLKRNVGIRVASLDYLENIKRIIDAPKIIDETEFRKTLKLATTDPLTGTYNRREFLRILSEEINTARARQNYIFSLLLLDLDGFKKFNDTQGHQSGDLLLQEFISVLKTQLRKQDVIGRYGGDEFVILLPQADRFSAKTVAEKIRSKIETEFKPINITVSIGIAEFNNNTSLNELISLADEALYRAKEFGGNKVVYFKSVELKYKPQDKSVTEVCCVGDFNRWNKNFGKMKYNPDSQEWHIKLELKPGVYKYKFLIDGTKWIPDPSPDVPVCEDGFGGFCSLLHIKLD